MAGGRQRKPSRLAKEIAGIEPEPGAEQPTKGKGKGKGKGKATAASKKKQKADAEAEELSTLQALPTATANVKAGGKRGRAVLNENGEVDIEEAAEVDVVEEDEDDDRLYCICLGHGDDRPMIQCEGCEDWCALPSFLLEAKKLTFLSSWYRFHFDCIQLDPAESQFIEAYYCDVCEESGSGTTRSESFPFHLLLSRIPAPPLVIRPSGNTTSSLALGHGLASSLVHACPLPMQVSSVYLSTCALFAAACERAS